MINRTVIHDVPFEIGDVVVFTPDDRTISSYGKAFARLRIYPGYVGPVVRITAGLVRVSDTLKAWPWTQFRRADSFEPGEIETYQSEHERRFYANQGPSPYHVGDRVRFRPSDMCDLRHGGAFRAAGLFPTMTGQVTGARDDGAIEIDHRGLFYHWSEFEPQNGRPDAP